MEFQAVVRRRKMVRSFADRPVPAPMLDRILANARRAPSAGFSQGWAFIVLEGRDQTDLFWEHTGDPEWRARPNWPGLLRAPVIIVPVTDEQAYIDRYREPDKGGGAEGWPVPYWLVDTSFAAMLILLSAVDAGLGALFFSVAHAEEALRSALGVPSGIRPIGAIALGWPDDQDRPSPSLARGHLPAEAVIHRGRW